MGVAGGSVPGTQKGMAVMPASPGKTHTGRVVQCETVTGQTPGQMAAATSDAASRRRIAGNYAVAAASLSRSSRRTVNDEKSRTFEIQKCAYTVKDGVRKQVSRVLEDLERVWDEHDGNPVARCVAVATAMERLTSNKGFTQYRFMVCQLGPYYEDELDSALAIIKNLADRQYGWRYHKEIVVIVKHMELQEVERIDEKMRGRIELLKDICLKVIDFELRYLRFIKDSSCCNKYIVIYSDAIMKDMLKCRYIGYRRLMDSVTENRIKQEKKRLTEIINTNLATGVTDQDAESLRKDAINRADDMMIRRRYHDFLRAQFSERKDEHYNKKDITTAEHLLFLREALELRAKCISELNDLDLLPRKIEAEVTQKARMLLISSLHSGVQPEKEVMDLIDDMVNNKVVSTECADLFLCCKELESLPQPAITIDPQNSELINRKFSQRVNDIFNWFTNNKKDTKETADMLKQLFHEPEYMPQIKTLISKEPDKEKIKLLRQWLCGELFGSAIACFYKHKGEQGTDKENFALIMSQFRHELAERIPYTFVMGSWNGWWTRAKLANTACGAWYCDIKKLSTAESFRKEDIDCLLDLKRLAPHVPNKDLWIVLEKTLANFFQVVLRDTGEIPAEEIEVLSQWVDGLSRVKCIGEQLKTNHELWKRTHGGAASARDTGLPDTPSTSAEVFDIDQAARKSVALKRSQITTASVTSDQAVSQAALVQSGSQKSSTVKSEASSMPTAKASTVNTPKTGVFFPESQGNIKRDTSCTFGTNDNEEEPRAPVPANTETVATQASQAVSPLVDADRPSSRATGSRQSAVTTQTPGQMAAAKSDTTSRRTTSDDYVVTVPGAKTARETESAVKSRHG